MIRYLLDTNVVSQIFRRHPRVIQRLQGVPIHAIGISAITVGELMYGLAKRPQARQLHEAVAEFLRRVDVFAWDSAAAHHYGALRAQLTERGQTLSPLDLLIAAQAQALGAVLVTNDTAFRQVTGLVQEDWLDP